MKLMTYNILDGGNDRLEFIVDAIKKESPDYLTINEANNFAKNNNKTLKLVAKEIGLPYFDIALSGEYDYHVAAFSKYPFKEIHKLQPLMRACIIALIETEIGNISIASLHLTPYSEDLRHPEIDLILKFQNKYKNRILMGDMNSLSKYDEYDSAIIKNFNEKQLKKFTTNGSFRFDAIDKIESVGYIDSALRLGKNKGYTVPALTNKDDAHSKMRLDYIFLSESLVPNLKSYEVIKNGVTEKASDHYPVVINF